MITTYLGDSVYCAVDGSGGIILTTRNGLPTDPSNTIYLEPEVYEALKQYATTMHAALAAAHAEDERRRNGGEEAGG